ncbi:hypothetical protein ACQ86O_23645 [Serratia sp. L9]|uniref:hypothetical protein n=1 Tax=Serratia sp. L9 TaxID=3423946 RepID=UPI003D664E07
MKELTLVEINAVSGAGFIKDGLSSLGSWLGNAGYNLVSSTLSINIPFFGNISLADFLPGLGSTVGSAIGATIGGTIEAGLAKIPFIGGTINKILGN